MFTASRIGIVVVLVAIGSCKKNNSLNSHLNYLSNKYEYFEANDWELVKKIPIEFGTEYYLKRQSDSISESFRFFITNEEYRLYNYKIQRHDDSIVHNVRIDDFDTTFYYVSQISNDSIVFLKGFYTYLYMDGYYSPDQLEYYFHNKDSLNQIKGHNLPELPGYRTKNNSL